ncbi:MAG: hypothetical protein QXP04_02995, partial [Candidatus Nanoarchaeia archaeon]|nr:hypothetical protein [Candidatus Jingweiarchaeum tengchongense]
MKKFIFLIFLSSLFHSIIITTNFVSNISSDYRTIVNLNISSNFTAVSNNVPLTNYSYLCINTPITMTVNNISNFTPISNVVECAFNCDTYSQPQSSFPQPIHWIDQTSFYGNRSLYIVDRSECIGYRSAQPPNPLIPYNFTSNYKSMTKSVSGIAGLGLFCYGNLTMWDGSIQIPFVYIPLINGTRELKVNLSLTECAVLTRALEQNGAMQDCWYHNTTINNMSIIESLVINYISGPNLTLTPTKTDYSVTPGGT